MSTFDGFVPEFPRIRIDRFRTLPGRPPPVACFLSHVHSDHLLGLDSFKGPFIYCSPATRELLLRLEKFPHRINFARGIAEVVPQSYRHLKNLLKPIPLETPTKIELSPGVNITATLFNANHCLGAVSFLIEDDSNAILYTGDIRAEAWILDAWTRHPALLPYVPGPHGPGLRRLSTIYLDTTFAVSSNIYRTFPSKAEGLSELLRSLCSHDASTEFYIHAWTFGYEEVWMALSPLLKSPIHLDQYRLRVYTSIRHSCGPGLETREAPMLCGTMLGNTRQPGILTQDPSVRLHSCEKGSGCPVEEGDRASRVVHIKPIVTRVAGAEITEVGLGGGQGDLTQHHELDIRDPQAVSQLKALCEERLEDPAARSRAVGLLERTVQQGETKLRLDSTRSDDTLLDEDLKLEQVVDLLAAQANVDDNLEEDHPHPGKSSRPATITFPYSRHSSYDELRSLVSAFRPHSVFPCTAPPVEEFTEERSMETLFGDCCRGGQFIGEQSMSEPVFPWDQAMRQARADLGLDLPLETDTQRGVKRGHAATNDHNGETQCAETQDEDATSDDDNDNDEQHGRSTNGEAESSYISPPSTHFQTAPAPSSAPTPTPTLAANTAKRRSPRSQRLRAREDAYRAALAGEWHTIHLQSTRALQQTPRQHIDENTDWS